MTDTEESVYNFNHEKRGIALLIHNEEFDRDSGYKHRPGDTGDFERMKEIFRSLGFDVLPYRNLTAQQILNEAKKASRLDVHHDTDCFACVIASHGEEMELKEKGNIKIKEHVIIGTDGKGVRTGDIVRLFDEDHCEALANKPKFFFIQACRTSNASKFGMDQGHTLTVSDRKPDTSELLTQTDNFDSKTTDNVDTRHMSSAELFLHSRNLVHHVAEVDCPEDTLLMFASLSNNYAVRNASAGGWLLTSLYSQIKEYRDSGKLWTTEFVQLLSDSLKEMTTKTFKPSDVDSPLYGAFSPGCFTHCLTKDVLFTKK